MASSSDRTVRAGVATEMVDIDAGVLSGRAPKRGRYGRSDKATTGTPRLAFVSRHGNHYTHFSHLGTTAASGGPSVGRRRTAPAPHRAVRLRYDGGLDRHVSLDPAPGPSGHGHVSHR